MDVTIKNKKNVEQSPLISELVDAMDTEVFNNIINKYIHVDSDKSIFMMFVTIVLTCQLQLKDKNFECKKELMKNLLTDIFKDYNKRKICLDIFEKHFRQLFQNNELKITNPLQLKLE